MLDPFDGSLRVDLADPLPRHTQVQNIVRSLVASGRLRPGDKIPAEVDVASALGVSKMTVNKALLALQSEGLLVRAVGRGTFVADGTTALPSTLPRIVLTFVSGERDILGNDYYGPLYQGIAEFFGVETDSPRAELILAQLNGGDYVDEDVANPADGRIIIAPRENHIGSVNALWNQGRALVVIGASWPERQYPCVDSDNAPGAALAVRHLIGLGHRRIALIHAQTNTANTQDRIRGYRDALAQNGIEPDPALEVQAALAWNLGEVARDRLHRLLTDTEPVTAIFASGYYMALEAVSLAHEQGLTVPSRVSVVGFDDPMGAQFTYPPLTTLRQPLLEMGRKAAERLSQLLAGAAREQTHDVLAPQLILRRSTASRNAG